MVFLAAFLDFFDGFLARLLKVEGELGKQLDSLADMVSFGVVPGIVMYQLLIVNLYISKAGFNFLESNMWLLYIALVIPLFSAYRLAKFNIDSRQTSGFIGLPTPANAIFFVSLPLVLLQEFIFGNQSSANDILLHSKVNEIPLVYQYINPFKFPNIIINNPYWLIGLIVIFSLLLVSPLPLFALKFKNFGWADNKIRYVFLALCAVLLILFQLIAIPFIVILYILTSIVNNIFKLTV